MPANPGRIEYESDSSSPLLDAVSGSISGIATECIFYGLDSYKVMLQAGQSFNVSRCLNGAIPIATLGSGLSFGVFFGFYESSKTGLTKALNMEDSTAVILASATAGVPSSLISVPADVLKKRILLNAGSIGIRQAFTEVVATVGLRGLMLGWRANLIKDVPFAVIKMSLYEGLARLYVKHIKHRTLGAAAVATLGRESSSQLSSTESALVGLGSGALTALVTNPLDCVNTRIKSGELARFGIMQAHIKIWRLNGPTALFRGLVPRTAILGLGSTVFWYFYAEIGKALAG